VSGGHEKIIQHLLLWPNSSRHASELALTCNITELIYIFIQTGTVLWSSKPTSLGFFPRLWRCGPTRAMASSFLRFLDHTQRRITVGRTSSPSQRPLTDNTQQSTQTNIHAPGGIRTHNTSRGRRATP